MRSSCCFYFIFYVIIINLMCLSHRLNCWAGVGIIVGELVWCCFVRLCVLGRISTSLFVVVMGWWWWWIINCFCALSLVIVEFIVMDGIVFCCATDTAANGAMYHSVQNKTRIMIAG